MLRMLGEMGTREDLGFLRTRLEEDRQETAVAAGEALVRLVERGVVAAGEAFPEEGARPDVVSEGIDRAVRRRLMQLAINIPTVEWSHGPAYVPLTRLGSKALPALLSIASDRARFGTSVRSHALVATGRIGGPVALAALERFLSELDALEETGPTAVRFRDDEENLSILRAAAVAALGLVGPAATASRDSMIDACDRPDVTVRAYGAWALFCVVSGADEGTRAEIARAAADDLYFEQDDAVLSTLALVLEASALPEHASVLATRLSEYPRLVDFFLLASMVSIAPEGEPTRQALERACEREDPAVRAMGLRHTGRAMPDELPDAVVDELIDELRAMVRGKTFGLRDESGTVGARSALVSLGFLGERAREAVEDVLAMTEDSVGAVRAAAAVSLGGLGGERARTRLVELVEGDANEYVRYFAGDALGRLGDPRAVPAMIDALETGNEFLARPARAFLRDLTGSTRGYDPTMPSDERASAIEAWRQWWASSRDRVRPDPATGSLRLDND